MEKVLARGKNLEAPLVSLRPERGEESQSTIVGNPVQAAHRAIYPVCCAENLVRHSVERGHPHILLMNILPDSQEMHGLLGKIQGFFEGLEILFLVGLQALFRRV